MSDLNLVERVEALHRENDDHTPCDCDECTETMDILKQIDSLPEMHLLKLGVDGWAIEHPVSCRLKLVIEGKTLHDCDLHEASAPLLHEAKPAHLTQGTYELEFRDGEPHVRKEAGGGGKWWPLREYHDPVSHTSRSPGT